MARRWQVLRILLAKAVILLPPATSHVSFFRAIYDCGDVRKFSRALEHRIHQYDRNIQKYDAVTISSQIQAASEDISKKSEEIVKYRKLVKNASTAIDQISVCLPVLENYAKLQELMQLKKYALSLPYYTRKIVNSDVTRYYQALKVLEELEHTHLALVEKYRFTQILAKTMAPVRNEIKSKAYSEFKDFLENVKKVACRIGRHASRCTAEQHSFGVSETERARRLQQEAKQKLVDVEIAVSADGRLVRKNTSNGAAVVEHADSLEDDEKVSAQDLIDFTPVHRDDLTVVGAVLERAMSLDVAKLSGLEALQRCETVRSAIHPYYHSKVMDRTVSPALLRKRRCDVRVQNRQNNEYGEILGGCPDVEMMLRMKKVILLFALTMKSYGYGIAPDQYNEILMSEYCAQFERDLEKDNYAPIVVENEQQFKAIIKEFPFYKRSMEQEPFPRKFPYSHFVVSAYSKAKLYLQGCLKFMEHLQLTQSEMDDTLVQITVNIGYLEKSCESLGVYITKLTSGNDLNVSMTAHQLSLTERVEQQIEVCIRDKVDAFIELAQYDWELPASSGHASEYISDLINYLSTTFLSFTNLPSVLARHVCMQTCKHLSTRLSDVLLSPDVRAISVGALEQFSLDVMQCEMFTARCPVPGFDHNTLPMTFAHLRQLLELVMSNDWTSYLAEYGQENGTYVRVSPSTATQLLEKMIEYEKKSSGFFAINKGDRKKLLDTIIRQLRALSAQ
ncbi:putative exocyst complex subunit Sec15 [Necator americanus]|uniref:Exocyst complex component n=1 Tax=Necator americanus TaxID=51031 RepID=W2SZ15_NECAM|nr:putative exocyst complex subunit Sec15 [Necator americanus]ETN73912.1 putative exocyst complex subunit Sec15 [Necator americanus]